MQFPLRRQNELEDVELFKLWAKQPHYSFSEAHTLGKGAFGSVYRAFSEVHQCEVAVKRIRKFKLRVSRELAMLASLHPLHLPECIHVIRMLGFQYECDQDREDKITQCILLELHPTNLNDFIFQNREIKTEAQIRKIVIGVLKGLAHLNEIGIMHRDLKPENILLDSSLNPVINDFGSAKKVGDSHNTVMMTAIPYRAPEMCLSLCSYDTKIDIWSTGCIFSELLTRQLLFQVDKQGDQVYHYFKILGAPSGDDLKMLSERMQKKSQLFENSYLQQEGLGLIKNIKSRMISRRSLEISEKGLKDFLSLIKKMLIINPSKRISAKEALKLPFCQAS